MVIFTNYVDSISFPKYLTNVMCGMGIFSSFLVFVFFNVSSCLYTRFLFSKFVIGRVNDFVNKHDAAEILDKIIAEYSGGGVNNCLSKALGVVFCFLQNISIFACLACYFIYAINGDWFYLYVPVIASGFIFFSYVLLSLIMNFTLKRVPGESLFIGKIIIEWRCK